MMTSLKRWQKLSNKSVIKIIKRLMMTRAAVRARERLLPFGIPKAMSSTTLMETRAIKDAKVRAGTHLLKKTSPFIGRVSFFVFFFFYFPFSSSLVDISPQLSHLK
jgi:hypothetical protein